MSQGLSQDLNQGSNQLQNAIGLQQGQDPNQGLVYSQKQELHQGQGTSQDITQGMNTNQSSTLNQNVGSNGSPDKEWQCVNCEFFNYKDRINCYKCNLNKPIVTKGSSNSKAQASLNRVDYRNNQDITKSSDIGRGGMALL